MFLDDFFVVSLFFGQQLPWISGRVKRVLICFPLLGPHANCLFFLRPFYCDYSHWGVVTPSIMNGPRNRNVVLWHVLKFGDYLHHKLFIDFFGSDSSLEQIQRRGKAFVSFFRKMDEFIGGLQHPLSLTLALITFALVVTILSCFISEDTMFFIICLKLLGWCPKTIAKYYL